MNNLYQLVDVLVNQNNITSQLNENVLFVTNNWNLIKDELEKKNNLLTILIDHFPNAKTSDLSLSFSNGLKLGAVLQVLGYKSYNYVSKNP